MMKNILFSISIIFLATFTAISKERNWSYINKKGETIFSIKANSVGEFKNGLAKIHKSTLVNNQWESGYGFINKSGKIIIPCQYKKAQDFTSTVTWVKKKGDQYYTLIGRAGNVIPTKKYDDVGRFYDFQRDICAVFQNGKMGFINNKGVEIIPCKYTGSTTFSDGLAIVDFYGNKKPKYGFINKKGEFVIKRQFYQNGITTFSDGLCRAKVGGKIVLIDTTGNIVFRTNKGSIVSQKNGRILVYSGPARTKWGWLNFNNEWVLQPMYDYVQDFNTDGYAVVEKNGLKGVIDTLGNIVLPLKYESVYCDISVDGYFLGVLPSTEVVSLAESRKDYFDENLNRINNESFRYLKGGKNTTWVLFSGTNQLFGYMDEQFNVIFPAQLEKAKPFKNGYAWVVFK